MTLGNVMRILKLNSILVHIRVFSNDDINLWMVLENRQLSFQSVLVVDVVIIHENYEFSLSLSEPVISWVTRVTIILKQPVYFYPLILLVVKQNVLGYRVMRAIVYDDQLPVPVCLLFKWLNAVGKE